MTVNILFAAHPDRWAEYEAPLRTALSEREISAHLVTDLPADEVDYIVYAPNSPVQDFTPFTRAKAVLNLWAGVENVVGNETLRIPLCRMVDPSLTQGMVEWVTGHVLRHHLGMDAHITARPGQWVPVAPPVSWGRKITVLGLGELGQACALSLAQLGFDVHGWARRQKTIDGVTCYAGPGGLTDALHGAHGVVLLLPDTPDTTNVMNARTLAMPSPGAFLLNPGRGALIEDAALLDALEAGQIGHATLDTFRIEPLPADHPFWRHPRVTVTPHIASETRARWAAQTIAENVWRGETGAPFVHVVDRDAGY